jgi:two-component system, chemotaxis family, chemotaxis protein CheY
MQPQTPPGPPARGAPTVLVVDDEGSLRQLVARTLADEGYAVVEAPDGAAALTRVRETPPAVILLDLRMPVMDGWGFARAYRQEPGPWAPVVVMTATVDAGRWAAEVGADAYLAKPFDLDALLAVVGRLVGGGGP